MAQAQQQGDETILDEAKSLMVQGKRFMALEDYQAATDCLEQACQLFDAFYGVAKRECADAYLEYGLALVALANVEAGTGTDKIMKKAGIEEEEEEDEEEGEEGGDEERDEEGEDEEAGDEEKEGQEEKGGEDKEGEQKEEPEKATVDDKEKSGEIKLEAETETGSGTEKICTSNIENASKTSPNKEVPMESTSAPSSQETKSKGAAKESKQAQVEQPQPQASSSSAPDPIPGTSDENADKDEDVDNEEATTIEIAWEVLCLAKRLYMTDESLEGRLKLAETLQKIGEISIEWDNNDNAVSILEECLKIRSAVLRPDDRLVALTYYNLGLAHSFKSDTQNANDNFQKAINVIEKRISTLSVDLEKAKSEQDTVAIGTYQKEINELKELLPDMTMRIDDSKEDGDKSTEVMKRTREEMQLEDEEAKKVCSDKSKPVDDISHLVKRKAT